MSERSIFLAALDIADPQKQAAFLQQQCGNDAALRQHIEELLAAEVKVEGFLDRPHEAVDMTADVAPLAEQAGSQLGPYKLLEQIGEGGFGVVFMAEQQQPVRRKVALKVLKAGMDTRQVIARFEAERQALALMDHPNIARVLDAGETTTGRPYFVMELVRGIPITQFCDEGQLTTRERLELFVTVCQAAQHAHQKGIIHRDIKPTNVLVTLHDGTPVVKVIDFGVAKATGQQLTEKTLFTGFAQMVGTPLYMSPEQAALSGLDIDTRSDIYSLGVLLYELLTGTTPLQKDRLKSAAFDEIRRIIREEEPIKPSTRISTLGVTATSISALRKTEPQKLSQLLRNEIDWIVMKALEKDRTRRYETASAFAADVGRYLRDEQVEACPPSTLYRLRKFARRNRAVLTTGASFFAALFVLSVFSVGMALVARYERDRARMATRNMDIARREAESQRDQAEKSKHEESRQRELAQQREAEAKAARLAEADQRRLAEQSERTAVRERNSTLAAKEELRETLYASEMNLVQAAAESHQYARAAQLLEQQRPAPGQSDLRGFEWHYWLRQLQRGRLRSIEIPQLASLERTSSRTRIFSRNGTQLVALVQQPGEPRSQATFGLLTIFDCSTGRELIAPFDPFPDKQDAESRIPLVNVSDDGTRLAATLSRRVGDGRPPGHISLHDGGTGREIRRIESPGNVKELALTADGSRLAVEYLEFEPPPTRGEVRREGRRIGELNQTEKLQELRQRLSRQQAEVKIWDTSTGELIQTLPKLPWTSFYSRILWSPDGKRLLRTSVTSEIDDNQERYRELFQVVDVASGEITWERPFPSHAIPRRAWSWSPDGKLVVIFVVAESGIAAKHNAQLWDSATGTTLAILDRENPSDATLPANIDFSPDGRFLAVVSGANEIYVWEIAKLQLADGSDPLHVAAPHLTLHTAGEGIQAVAFSADGRELHTVAGASLVTWDATAREDLGVGPDSLEGYFISAISADATKVAFSTGSLRTPMSCLWDLTRNQEVFRLPTGGAVSRPGFSADGRRVALAQTTSTSPFVSEIVIYDTQTGEALSTVKVDQNGLPSGAYLDGPAFRPDRGQLAALIQPFRRRSLQSQSTDSPQLIAWDTATGQQMFSVPIEATFAAGLVYSLDGSSLVVGTSSQGEMAAMFYDATTGERQRSVAMRSSSRTAVLILARHQIFANFVGSDALFLDLETGQERFRLPGYHDLEDVAISPDGSRLAAGRPVSRLGGDSEVTLWSLKTGHRLLTLKRKGTMETISFSPDGNRLVATFSQSVPSATKPIHVWDATPLPEEASK
jgi:serine/threonine protein kinase/WD40 repeat protein